MARVLLIGGHGKIALLATPRLVGYGHQVTSAVRNPDHESDVRSAGGESVVADVESMDVTQLEELASGHDVVVWAAGAGGGNPARTRAVDHDAAVRTMEAATAGGVKNFVMVSYFGSHLDHGVSEDQSFYHYAQAKAEADEYLRGTDLNWVILGPSLLTDEDASGQLEAQVIHAHDVNGEWPKPDLSNGQIARDNVASLIAAVVARIDEVAGTQIVCNDGDEPIADLIDRAAR